MANNFIYLDYNSTTPVNEEVLKQMLPFFTEKFGNASSTTHKFGLQADDAVKNARMQVAGLLGCLSQEIIFTSGATEAANIAIKGVFKAYKSKGKHIVTVKTEHKAVLDVYKKLEKEGAEVTYLNVGKDGLINTDELIAAITEKTILVSIMYANNETGIIQDVKSISKIIHSKGSIFFCDATQAIGKIPVNVMDDGIDLLALSSHKIYGPKGVGALYIRRKGPRVTLSPILDGGGQEKGIRPGTLNVPGIVGIGKACEIASRNIIDFQSIGDLRNAFEHELIKTGKVKVNGNLGPRLPNTSSLIFNNIKADRLITSAPLLAMATGSACTSAMPEPSHVLKAMGLTDEEAFSTLRFSLGYYTTPEDIRMAIEILKTQIKKLNP